MKQISDPLAGKASKSHPSVLVTGDQSFAESYQAREEERSRENIPRSRGYEYSLEKLSSLPLKSDLVLGNFETTKNAIVVGPGAGPGEGFVSHA